MNTQHMLIQYYNPQDHKKFNNSELLTKETIEYSETNEYAIQSYNNLPYYTTPLDIFTPLKQHDLIKLIDDQKKLAEQEANLLLKHGLLTTKAYDITLRQYSKFFFYKGFAYSRQDILNYAQQTHNQLNTYITNQPNPPFSTQPNPTIQVSRQAIRNITGYSYNAIRQWDETHTPVYVEWQHKLLEDDRDIIVVDGSRQIGKSFTISQKLIEESHIPDNDSLVGAFLEKTTNVIRNYVLRLTKKFPLDYFTNFKKEGYIINNKTGTRIYFRTLSDGGDNVLGLTLKRAIIDEAQFVPESTFEDAINPTLSTTGGQLILIGTPSKKKTGYMYKTIMDMKRHIISPEEGSYYKVSVDENPFIHPKKRKYIIAHKNEPSIRRQYYNEWGDVGDSLFSIQPSTHCPTPDITPDSNNFLVIGIDPARLNDRSAFSIIYCYYDHNTQHHQATIIFSGQVPDTHKKDWNMQALFYKTLIQKWGQTAPHTISNRLYTVMDVTGVGDGVSVIFQSAGIKINAKIRYTSGLIESNDGINFKVAKTILINNFVDMCQEGIINVYKPANQDLIEELSYIEEGESKSGTITTKSEFFDDITNASMIAAYFINKRKLIGRTTTSTTSPYSPQTQTHIENIENRTPINTNLSSVW